MGQNTSCYPHYMPGQTASTGSLDIKCSGQGTENSLDPMANMPQNGANVICPLFLLVVAPQGQQMDAALVPQPIFQFLIIVRFVSNDAQITTVQEQGIKNFQFMYRSWSQQPLVNQLLGCDRCMKTQAEELGC